MSQELDTDKSSEKNNLITPDKALERHDEKSLEFELSQDNAKSDELNKNDDYDENQFIDQNN